MANSKELKEKEKRTGLPRIIWNSLMKIVPLFRFAWLQLNNSTMFDISPLQNVIELLEFIPFMFIITDFVKHILVSILAVGPIPRHVGLIMDGNRRYAKKMALPFMKMH